MKFEELKNENFIFNELEIKQYIPISKKYIIINGFEDAEGLVNSIVQKKNGLYTIDRLQYEVEKVFAVLIYYADIDCTEIDNVVEAYDYIMENGIYHNIVDIIGNDYADFCTMLSNAVQDKLKEYNSIEGILARGLDSLNLKLDDLTDNKKLDKMMKVVSKHTKENPELISMFKDALSKKG